MAKFVYVYIGGQMAETPEAQEQAMQAWGSWFGTLGDSVADMGNPFGNSATVSSGGVADGGKSAPAATRSCRPTRLVMQRRRQRAVRC